MEGSSAEQIQELGEEAIAKDRHFERQPHAAGADRDQRSLATLWKKEVAVFTHRVYDSAVDHEAIRFIQIVFTIAVAHLVSAPLSARPRTS
jgi:hypothetical protein